MDINSASNVNWRKDMLAFVPGLGPRKAQALLQVVCFTFVCILSGWLCLVPGLGPREAQALLQVVWSTEPVQYSNNIVLVLCLLLYWLVLCQGRTVEG